MTRSLLPLVVLLALVARITAHTGKRNSAAVRTSERAIGHHPAILGSATRHDVDPRVLWTIFHLETRFRSTLLLSTSRCRS